MQSSTSNVRIGSGLYNALCSCEWFIWVVTTSTALFTADIYGKNVIGGYSNYVVTKSLTDVLLYNEPIRLTFDTNNEISFPFSFMNINSNTDIGSYGSLFESLTLYFGFGTSSSTTAHECSPVEMTCFKALANSGLKNNADASVLYMNHQFNTLTTNYYADTLFSYLIAGTISFGTGDASPKLIIKPYKEIFFKNYTTDEENSIDTTGTGYNFYLFKVVGHRKVGKGY